MFYQAAVAVAAVIAFAPVQAEQLVGQWDGVLATPDGEFMPVSLRVLKGADGKITALADAPGDAGIAVTDLALSDGVVGFQVSGIPGRYQGRLEGDTITGNWIDDQGQVELNLKRVPAQG